VSEAKVEEIKRRDFQDRCGAGRRYRHPPPIDRRHPTDRTARPKPSPPEYHPLNKGPTTPRSSLRRFSGGSVRHLRRSFVRQRFKATGSCPIGITRTTHPPPHTLLPTRRYHGVLATTGGTAHAAYTVADRTFVRNVCGEWFQTSCYTTIGRRLIRRSRATQQSGQGTIRRLRRAGSRRIDRTHLTQPPQ
jgi:hypothetical protein